MLIRGTARIAAVGGAGWVALRLLALRALCIIGGRELVLIGLMGNIGDVIAAEPIARRVRERHPSALIIWMVSKGARDLVSRNPAIDCTIPVKYLSACQFARRIGFANHFYDLHVPGFICKALHTTQGASKNAPFINLQNYYDHGCLLSIFSQLAGIPFVDEAPMLYLRKTPIREALPSRYIVAHCTSTDPARDWPKEKWSAFVQDLARRYGLPVVEVGLASTLVGVEGVITKWCGHASLRETADIIRGCVCFVGIDSGPAHIANALRVPAVILIGQLAAFHNHMPFSGVSGRANAFYILRTDGPLSKLGEDEVLGAVSNLVEIDRPS